MSLHTTEVSLDLFREDPRHVARALLGMTLVTVSDEGATGGMIVETEAYLGNDDPGSHASTKGITRRNATMYGPPARTYVYLVYGMHHMLNFVCLPEGEAGAVLIRAIEPTIGLDVMSERRGVSARSQLASGPGRLAEALGITLADNASALDENRVILMQGPDDVARDISVSGRIGLTAGGELQLRYYLTDSPFVSCGGRRIPSGGSMTPNDEQERA